MSRTGVAAECAALGGEPDTVEAHPSGDVSLGRLVFTR